MKSPLYNAADNNKKEIVSILLKKTGINVNQLTKISLLMLFIISNLILISRFIKYFYRTPLHVAVYNQNLEIIEMLLRHPAIDTTIIDDILALSFRLIISKAIILMKDLEIHVFLSNSIRFRKRNEIN
ncbi:hypothetical protein M9Y10_028345 [Tritrichomonas musculus]|uniref:Ankyrin repeat protein n=1 Tax=Tritrichomonas musculus TaxID=1915356 RepID=A0ABR2KMD5_9EUKA